jgi:hypothetical protein
VTAQCDANNRSAIGRDSAQSPVTREKVGNTFPVITLGNLETLDALPQLKRRVVIADGKFARFDVVAHSGLGGTCLTSGRLLVAQFLSLRNGDYEMKPSQQPFVDPGAIAGGEDCEAGIFLASSQEIIDFNVGIAVGTIFHVSAFAKKSICLIKKQDRMTILRRIENTAEILLGLANISRDDGIQIDPV